MFDLQASRFCRAEDEQPDVGGHERVTVTSRRDARGARASLQLAYRAEPRLCSVFTFALVVVADPRRVRRALAEAAGRRRRRRRRRGACAWAAPGSAGSGAAAWLLRIAGDRVHFLFRERAHASRSRRTSRAPGHGAVDRAPRAARVSRPPADPARPGVPAQPPLPLVHDHGRLGPARDHRRAAHVRASGAARCSRCSRCRPWSSSWRARHRARG